MSMNQRLKEKMEEAYERELRVATICCESCKNNFIENRIYFEYGFIAAHDLIMEDIESAIATVKGWYPEDVFLPDGNSIDAKCAAMARKTCDNILAELCEKYEGEK